MELIKIENGQIEIAQEFLTQWKEFQQQKEVMELQEKKVKQALLEAMEANGIKKWDNELLSATYVEPQVRKIVDTQALKSEGLYDLYTKESVTKPSVRITWK